MKLTELFGKNVVNEKGDKQGYVLRVLACGDRVEYLVCADGNEKEFTVAYAPMQKGSDTLLFQTEAVATIPCRTLRPCELFDEDGTRLGKVRDFTLQGNRITHAHVGKRKIPFADMVVGDVALLRHREGYIENKLRAIAP